MQCWPKACRHVFPQENNLYNCLDLPVPTLYKNVTCAMFAYSPQATLDRKMIYNFVWIYLGEYCIRKLPAECYEKINVYKAVLTMMGQHCIRILSSQCSLYAWDSIALENCLCNVGPELTGRLSHKNRPFQICLVTCFLTGYNITKQSLLFLFSVSSGFIYGLRDSNEHGSTLTGTSFSVSLSDVFYLFCYCNILK